MTIDPRTELRRKPERGSHDTAVVHAVLDAAYVCHLGITDEHGRPVVLPTTYARVGDRVYVHGSPASRLLRRARSGIDVCCTVTVVDGLVLAKSAFHHSMNYRSVVIFGSAVEVRDLAEKRVALRALVEAMVAGRSEDCRPPTDRELTATTVLALDLATCSAKTRTGGPVDDAEDEPLPYWAGVVPVTLRAGRPEPAATCNVVLPTYLTAVVGRD